MRKSSYKNNDQAKEFCDAINPVMCVTRREPMMRIAPVVTVVWGLLLVPLVGGLAWAQTLSDLEIFQLCLGGTPVGVCAAADVNKDELINLTDFNLFRGASRGDFNADKRTDLRVTSDNQDLNHLTACLGQAAANDCGSADLNGDGLIDDLDTAVFNGFIIYDLNADSVIDFSTHSGPVFKFTRDITVKEQESISFYIWASNNVQDTITYTLEQAPAKAALTPVIMGDVNDDGVVDDQDISLIAASDKYAPQFDLNNDQQVNQQDIEVLQALVGTQNRALRFEWVPGNRDSGIYEIRITAQDSGSVASQEKITLTVNDLDAFTNYYSYDDVLLIINVQSAASQTIGEYFAASRGIPPGRIATISTPESETISRQTFEQDVRLPVENFIRENQLESAISYIVTTKGVPLRISTDKITSDRASVDSELSLILGPYADQIGAVNAVPNPYHAIDYPFSREMFGIYLVTRLTGYTVTDVLTLIDRSAQPAQTGTFVLDVDPTKDAIAGSDIANQWLRDAAVILEKAGQTVLLDQSAEFVVNQTGVLGYAGWGSNDANVTDNAKPKFTWLAGSIAETYVSTSARTFTAGAVYGQSLVADLIAEGATGVKGYVYEPYLSTVAKPMILFDRYVKGYSLADSYYAASSSLGWQDVVVGDPKMILGYQRQNPNDNKTPPQPEPTPDPNPNDNGTAQPNPAPDPNDKGTSPQPTPKSKSGSSGGGVNDFWSLGLLVLGGFINLLCRENPLRTTLGKAGGKVG
jgi:uncharacterized protein (TIGR03790 family)